MSTYPASIDNGSSLPLATDLQTPVQASVFNALRNATLAIETTLGVQPAGIYGTVSGRLTTLEGSVGNIQSISLAGDLGGTLASPLVIGIQGRPVSSMAPNSGQVLTWNGIAWVPGTASTIPITFGKDLSGNSSIQTVIGIQGFAVSTATPVTGQVLEYNGTEYVPVTISGAFSAGRDLSGTSTLQTVVGLQGHPVSATAPTTNQVLQYNGTDWIPTTFTTTLAGDVTGSIGSNTVHSIQGVVISGTPSTGQVIEATSSTAASWQTPAPGFTAGGDLTGSSTNQTVAKIDGASVPAAGSLTTGNVLQVTGASALSYAPVNLAGGSNYVTGSLPAGNQVAQNMGGAVGGTTAASTISLTSNSSITGILPSANQAAQTMGGAVGGTTAASTISLTSNSNITGVLPTANQADQSLTLTGDVTSSGGNTGGATTTVAAIQGVTISSTPSSGYVLTATSSTAANWQAISSGSVTLSGDVTGAASSNTVGKIQGNTVTSGALVKGDLFIATTTSNWAATAITGDVSFSATTPGLTVVNDINGASVPAAGSLTTGNVLQVSGASALTYAAVNLAGGSNYVTGSLPTGNQAAQSLTLVGDTTGSGTTASTTTTTVKINGASVPTAGSLTTGNGLYVTGASALSYSALNLAGGSNYVTGALPNANQAPQTMGGDVTGTTAASTVAKIQGNTVTSGALVEGDLLIATSTSNWAATAVTGDVSFSTSTPGLTKVTALQGNSVSASAPSSGQILEFVGSTWTPTTPTFTTSNAIGLASARSSATGSGKLYFCTDIPAMYFDDPGSSTWKQFPFEYTPAAPPVSSYTVSGGVLALTQYADAIRAMSLINNGTGNQSSMALIASGALGATAAWTVSLTASLNPLINVQYFEVGVCVANGTTTGTSVTYGMSIATGQEGSSSIQVYLQGASEYTIGNGRTGTSGQLTGTSLGFLGNGRWHMRLLNDGTLLHYQISADGMQWSDFWAAATPTPAGGFTNYGFWLANGLGVTQTQGQAIIYSNSLGTPTQYTVSAYSFASPLLSYTIGTHSIQVGDFISVHGATGGVTNMNTGTTAQNGYNAGAGGSPSPVGQLVVAVTSTTVTTNPAASVTGTYTPNSATLYLLSR
jgi:hypothetical protein